MNRAQIQYEKCKRIAQHNTKCLNILLKFISQDREDIIDQISELNKVKYNTITPEGIVALYNRCGEDINKVIATYDKTMDNVDYIHKNFYDDYVKGVNDFCNDN